MDNKNANQLHIRFESGFENITPAVASRLAMELKERLETASNKLSVKLHNPDPNTQNLGSELFLFLQNDLPPHLIAIIMVDFFKEKGGYAAIVIEDCITKMIFRVAKASEKAKDELKRFLSKPSETSDKDKDDQNQS